jgi:peptide subunit release factor 1 (eRF1)
MWSSKTIAATSGRILHKRCQSGPPNHRRAWWSRTRGLILACFLVEIGSTIAQCQQARGANPEWSRRMATDPVKSIQTIEHEAPLVRDLPATLAWLASLPPSTDAPYLTVCLDWRPEGTEPGRLPPPELKRSERRAQGEVQGAQRRPSWQQVSRELDDLVVQHGPRGAAFDSLSADVERIKAYIDSELDPAAQGVFIVACSHLGVFEPVPLDVPVKTEIVTGAIPSLRPLVHAAEDAPPYAVLVANQREADLWVMARQTWERGVQLEANDYPRKQKQGGWSQRRYQSRADERVDAFARTIAEETRVALGEGAGAVQYLILSAEEPMASAIDAELHETVKERIIGRISLPKEANFDAIVAEAAPIVAAEERRQELAAVQAVRDGVGAGNDGVAGAEDTLAALQAGQAMTLVVNDDFGAPGWADYTLPLYGVGEVPRQHPAGGDAANLVAANLADVVVRLALQTDAEVELVQSWVPITEAELERVPDASDPKPRAEAARALDDLGGIGAILRFSLAEQEERTEG